MDLTSHLLLTFHLNSSVVERARFCGHWNLDTSGSGHAAFHVLAGGQCWLHRVDGAGPMLLNAGDVLILPRDAPHVLSDSFDTTGHSTTDIRPLGDGSSEGTDLICGFFRFDDRVANPLLEALPDYLIVRSREPGNEAMRRAIDWLVTEAAESQPGVNAVLDRLSDAIFILAIRVYLRSGVQTGLAAALADPAVNRALQLLHESPERKWNLKVLSREVAVSRSALMQRFSGAVGESPMAYLTRWRIKLAARWLREGMSVAEVAERCGYSSEAGFAKAYKRHAGRGPGAQRRRRDHPRPQRGT